MRKFFREKIINRVRQYGFRSALVQMIRALIRLLYKVDQHIVFIIPEFAGYSFSDRAIKPLTTERIIQAVQKGDLEQGEGDVLTGFLVEGCVGVCAMIDGRLAGYSWTQFKGEHKFGRAGLLMTPAHYAIIYHTFVLPEYRGHELYRKLVAACMSLIPAGHIPFAFVMPENRIPIRNLEKIGFRRVLQVKRWRWFLGRWHMAVYQMTDGLHAVQLEQALIEGHSKKYSSTRTKGDS